MADRILPCAETQSNPTRFRVSDLRAGDRLPNGTTFVAAGPETGGQQVLLAFRGPVGRKGTQECRAQAVTWIAYRNNAESTSHGDYLTQREGQSLEDWLDLAAFAFEHRAYGTAPLSGGLRAKRALRAVLARELLAGHGLAANVADGFWLTLDT